MTEFAYDAGLLVGFGGPESTAEVMPFLQRVASAAAGRSIPAERLAAVAEHYYALGGASPINAQNRELLAGLTERLAARGVDVPFRLAHRNSAPFVPAVLSELAAAGHRRVLAFAASAFSSYSGCRQYREDLAGGLAAAGLTDVVEVVKIRPFADLPGFRTAWADRLAAGLVAAGLTTDDGAVRRAAVLFTTHSLPLSMAAGSGPDGDAYLAQHQQVAAAVLRQAADRVGLDVAGLPWQLVFQSRSGPPHVPWLEPDVNDALRALATQRVDTVVVVPLGFLTDHMEVVWDLDHELAATAAGLGVRLVRVPTVGSHPVFLDALAELVQAHLTGTPPEPAGPAPLCTGSCCLPAPGRPSGPPTAPPGRPAGGPPAGASRPGGRHTPVPAAATVPGG